MSDGVKAAVAEVLATIIEGSADRFNRPLVGERRMIEIITRRDRMSRFDGHVTDTEGWQKACGGVALPVQYVEDMAYLLGLLGVESPR